jgi:nitroreductase
MASRRSCRRYTDRPVARDALVDLVKIGATAPSGTNSQGWRFSILPDRAAVVALGGKVGGYFRLLNRLVAPAAVGKVAKVLGHPEVEAYRRDYRKRIEEGLDEWARGGRDRLFHGAPAAILVGSVPGAATATEDALLATQNILLAAHAMGLGTCLVGFAVHAIRSDSRVRRWLALTAAERVHAVIAVGYPDETYVRTTGRLPVPIRFVER